MYKKFNLSSIVKIKLTLQGKLLLLKSNYKFLSQTISFSNVLTREDSEGYVTLRLWEFIKIFGTHLEGPNKNYFFEDCILIDNETEEKTKKLVNN